MKKKTIEVSINPLKSFFILVLLALVTVGIIFLVKYNSDKKTGSSDSDNSNNQGEIILPAETGVSDYGFEGKNISFSVLNIKAILDQVEEIDGKQSLKIYFSENSNASVKIEDYINSLEKGGFYKLSFLAKNSAEGEKVINTGVIEKGKSQNLGKATLVASEDVQYVEFNFQAENSATDLVFTSNDSKKADVWIDDVMIEKLNIDSLDQIDSIEPTIFGSTSRYNVDQSQTKNDADSGDFFANPTVKMGQIISPSQPLLSGVSFMIQKVGNGGSNGNYLLQIREYDENLGIISSDVIASRNIYTDYTVSVLDEIKEKEKQMREEFAQNEEDILEGRIPNDETTEQYPSEFTQQQIDESKAQNRKKKFEIALAEMKSGFNVPYEIRIPIAMKFDTSKKYWIGIDNSKVKNDKRNYIKVFYNSSSEAENSKGFSSNKPNMWQEHPALWFKTFYPKHSEIQGGNILSGATISDFGNGKALYMYRFDGLDYTSLEGFSGRKIYDIYDSNYEKLNESGDYDLSLDQYATYKFNTKYPAKKIIIREAKYNQSLAIDFSSDGENWEEVLSENPAKNGQKINPFSINPQEKSTSFYLRLRSGGNESTPTSFSLEAELEKL